MKKISIIEDNIIYEDNHLIVVNKPSGLLTQGDYSGEESLFSLLKEYIREKYNKPGNVYLAMIHRLDRPVSGLLVFGKTSKAAQRLNRSFKSQRVVKVYVAMTEGLFNDEDREIWHLSKGYISRHRDLSVFSLHEKEKSQSAELLFYPFAENMAFVRLITGRKHQIRCQMQFLGQPIRGDAKYGSKNIMKDSIALHSLYLSLEHPVKKEKMTFYSQPPQYFDLEKDGLQEKIEKALESFSTPWISL